MPEGDATDSFPNLNEVEAKLTANGITLPSDKIWRMKNYFILLDEQKRKGKALVVEKIDDGDFEWLDDGLSPPAEERPHRTKQQVGVLAWRVDDIVSAACLLISQKTALSTCDNQDSTTAEEQEKFIKSTLDFRDEQEMRRIFSLLFDVFRYKSLLKQALDEAGFTRNHPELRGNWPVVWLLLYDLYKRDLLPREHSDQQICHQAFLRLGIVAIDEALNRYKVRLAAAMSRARVIQRALFMDDLLPPHLRDERLLAVDEAPVTAWVNTFLAKKGDMFAELEELGLCPQLDHVCPKLLILPTNARTVLASSKSVLCGRLVLQDREFCLSAAHMNWLVRELSLRGSVVQSDVISPRATAYLAVVLMHNPNIRSILAFGAGVREPEYTEYLYKMGVKNCRVFKERLWTLSTDSNLLQDVVAVLASPATSWTGVADPVDLVVARGGDMDMLRALTQPAHGHDHPLLHQQARTLRFAMSQPQVQVVLYESHSVSPLENEEMVLSAVRTINQCARDKHEEEQRLLHHQEQAEEKLSKTMLPGGTPAQREQREREALEAQEAQAHPVPVQVPDCDLFEIKPLPELCGHGQKCIQEIGCFIARIQRMEITGLDAKYMIKIAEARGLFGTDPGQKKPPTARSMRKQETIQRKQSSDQPQSRRKRVNLDRLLGHTHASLSRSMSSGSIQCARYLRHLLLMRQANGLWTRGSLARLWWQLTLRAIRHLLPKHSQPQDTPRKLRLPRSLRRTVPIHTLNLPERRNSC